jgi:dihydroxy-acid dehydratase
VIGITATGSAYNPCHGNMPQLLEALKRGIQLAGGLPMEFPTISLHESFAAPTSMYLRNLMSMDTEEMVRAQPMDAVVLIGGCDKTVPAQLMGAASANVPAVQLITGSMLTGSHRGETRGRLHRLPPLLGQVPRRRKSTSRRSPTSTTSWWPASAPAR